MDRSAQSAVPPCARDFTGCAYINVEKELAYWRGCHARGHLGPREFEVYARHVKLGFDLLLTYPRAREGQLMALLRDAWQRLPGNIALPWDETRWLVQRAWQRVAQLEE